MSLKLPHTELPHSWFILKVFSVTASEWYKIILKKNKSAAWTEMPQQEELQQLK